MREIIKRQSKIHSKSIQFGLEMMSIVVMSKLVLQSTKKKGISPQNNDDSMIPS